MTTTHLVLMILVAGACTFATRLFPFALFGQSKEVPKVCKIFGQCFARCNFGYTYRLLP